MFTYYLTLYASSHESNFALARQVLDSVFIFRWKWIVQVYEQNEKSA